MRILYATDGSEGALGTAQFLQRLPLGPEDSILVLAVGEAPEAGDWAERSAAALEGVTARVETRVAPGSPAEEILRTAEQEGVDLVAIGAVGHTGLVRFFIGSVAERVLRHAAVSVLVGRPVRFDLRCALVGVDPSEVSHRVVEAAARFPLPPETEFHLATVLPSEAAVLGVAPMLWASLAGELDEILQDALADAERRLREHARVLQAAGRRVRAEVLRGEPSSQLLAAVEKESADLLVVGSRGEGGMDRFLLGSVSERVARHARASVLVVR